MFYHVRLYPLTKGYREFPHVIMDLYENEVKDNVIDPFLNNKKITIKGQVFDSSEIQTIKISMSVEKSTELRDKIPINEHKLPIHGAGIPTDDMIIAEYLGEVTSRFISDEVLQKLFQKKVNKNIDNKKIFIVHGHDHFLKNELELFLIEIGFEPVVLHRLPDSGKTLIEKFESFSNVVYSFILLTPDDLVLKNKNLKSLKKSNLCYRARQNVIFEFGFFVGKLGREKVCCIYKSEVELPSDINGLIYKKVKNSLDEIKYEIIKELENLNLILAAKHK